MDVKQKTHIHFQVVELKVALHTKNNSSKDINLV